MKSRTESSHALIARLQADLAAASREQPTAASLPLVEALARALGAQDRWREACDVYTAFLRRCPDSGDGWYNFALIRRASGDLEGALGAYDQALAVNVGQPEEVHANRGVLFGELERHPEAEAAFAAALDSQPGYPPALYNLALLREEFGDWPAARSLLRQLLQQDPDHADALARLAHGERHDDPRAAGTGSLIAAIERLLQRRQLPVAQRETLFYARGKVAEDAGDCRLAGRCYTLGNQLSRRRVGGYARAQQEQLCEQVLSAHRAAHRTAHRAAHRTAPPVAAGPDGVGPIFVCGLYRSGSTLLEQMLGAHPDLAPAGELRYFNQRAPLPAALGDLYGAAATAVADGYLAMLAERFPASTMGQLLNKQPDNLWYAGWLCQQYPRARVLVTRRDSKDNAISVFAQQLSAEYPWANDLSDIAHYQTLSDRLTAAWQQQFPVQVHVVSYEHLIRAPQETLTEALAFLGRQWDPACLDRTAVGARVRTASVGQVREPLHDRSIGRGSRFDGFLG